MRERGMWLWPKIVGMLFFAGVGTAWADQSFSITDFRTDSVTLYKDCKMDQGVQIARQQFQGPWPATKDPNSSLYFHVVRDGQKYCVKAFSVKTDQAIKVDKDAECGAMIAGSQLKSGAVRGVGEGCSRGKPR
jgi:hypothetical protein